MLHTGPLSSGMMAGSFNILIMIVGKGKKKCHKSKMPEIRSTKKRGVPACITCFAGNMMTELTKKKTIPHKKMTPYLHSHTILRVQISLPLRLTLTYTQEERGKPGMWVSLIHFSQQRMSAKSALTGPHWLARPPPPSPPPPPLRKLNRPAYSGYLRGNVSGAYATEIPVQVCVSTCSCKGPRRGSRMSEREKEKVIYLCPA